MEERRPINYIPRLDELYNVTKEYIERHQGEKGYIDTQDNNGKYDTLYGIEYSDFSQGGLEKIVHGVKVSGGEILILIQPITTTYNTVFTDDDFKESEDWVSLRYSDVYYVPTLFNIAENIHEYTTED